MEVPAAGRQHRRPQRACPLGTFQPLNREGDFEQYDTFAKQEVDPTALSETGLQCLFPTWTAGMIGLRWVSATTPISKASSLPSGAPMSAPFIVRFGPSWLLLGVALMVTFGSVSCTQYVQTVEDLGPQAYYQTGFPLRDSSQSLERAFDSVKRIQTRASYDTYVFAQDNAPFETDPLSPELLASAVDTVSSPQDRAATAVVLSRTGRNVTLVTVAHVLTFPDTIVEYFDADESQVGLPPALTAPRHIESISIKTRQTNWVLELPEVDSFEILATEARGDVALIGVEYREGADPEEVVPLRLSIGNSDRLVWGSFVYVLGFPRGYPMVTRGVVSAPDHPVLESFVVDGIWNRGMSGGLILAVRGDGEGLEWVGMAQAAAGSTELRLVPEEGALFEHDIRRPYVGPIFLEEYQRIDYGITLSVPMTTIRRFLNDHRRELGERGYQLPSF